MRWKVYKIQTGQLIKAGFRSEEDAKDWLEENRAGREDNYIYEEMDEDEEEEWLESQGKDGGADEEVGEWPDLEDEEDFERDRYTYRTEEDDDEDDEDSLGEGMQVDDSFDDDL